MYFSLFEGNSLFNLLLEKGSSTLLKEISVQFSEDFFLKKVYFDYADGKFLSFLLKGNFFPFS